MPVLIPQSALPPFNPTPTCRKCHNSSVHTNFFARGERNGSGDIYRELLGADSLTALAAPYEFILRRCDRCRFAWAERPLDTTVAELGQPPNDCATPLSIWTVAYRPFILGGRVRGPVQTTVLVPATRPFDSDSDPAQIADFLHAVRLAHGVYLTPIEAPNGVTFYAEITTGALMGTDLDVVRKDLEEARDVVIKDQLAQSLRDRVTAPHITPAEFWSLLGANAPTPTTPE